MFELPKCPKCQSEYTYELANVYVCPECHYEWSSAKEEVDVTLGKASAEEVIRDAYGNQLEDGDSVSIIKDLKVKGSSSILKIGTTVKNIQLVDGDHDIDCKIDGFGQMKLKSEFVKKL